MTQPLIAAAYLPNLDHQVWSMMIPKLLEDKENSAGDASIEAMIELGEE